MSAYLPHQIEKSDEASTVLRKYGLAYIFGQPRSGKTATAIRVCERSQKRRILVLTPKNAIPGWRSELDRTSATKDYTVTNYEQASKLNSADYDFAIIDEAHRVGRVGKPTKRITEIKRLTHALPVLYLSGTPIVETPLAIYYQLSLTKYSPLRQYATFYKFFRDFGIPNQMRINGRYIEQYNRHRPELLTVIEPYIVRMTQADAGISVQAEDVLHVVPLRDSTKQLIQKAKEDAVITLDGELVAFESDMAERLAVHQIEYGALKVDDDYADLDNREVVDYILETWGDTEGLALMCHYKSTRMKLEKHFKRAQIFSSTAHAEGVSLADFEHFVIVGTCFSGAKHVQRRERGININKKTGSVVNHIVTDDGISRAVYNAVSKKKDFNLQMYRRTR